MNLDLRLPIGLLFAIYGVILTVFGLTSDPAIYERSLGIDVNLWWGLILLLFGAGMLTFAVRARGQGPNLSRTDSTSTP